MLLRCLLSVPSLFILTPALYADGYAERVQPFVRKYCLNCHNPDEARGELDLTQYGTARRAT